MEPAGLTSRRRVLWTLAAVLFAALGLIARLTWIQVGQGERWSAEGLKQRLRLIPVQAARGEIVDDRGRLVAVSVSADSVYAIPAQVTDPRSEGVEVARILGVPADRVVKRMHNRSSFVWLARRVDRTQALAVRREALPGVGIAPDARRRNVYGSTAAQVLGIVGVDNQGLEGVELSYDDALRGIPGSIGIEVDARNRTLPFPRTQYTPAVPGARLQLTLDLSLQRMAENEIDQAVKVTGSRAGLILITDPRTGAIRALAQWPTYDPNHYSDYPASSRRNLAVSDDIPPGSTFKPITLAAALDTGKATRLSSFYDPGFVRVQGRTIHCWRHGGHGAEDLAAVVANSCNVGFVELGLRLGIPTFYQYLRRFNLLSRTGVDLPGEASSIVPPVKEVQPVDLAAMAFGQTLAVTPLQLAAAVGAVADGGVFHRPHVVRFITLPHQRPVGFSGRARRVVSLRAAHEAVRLMEGVVARGTGKNAKVPGYRVAGKTGTAQAVINGRYVEGRYIASFIGFGPLPRPNLLMLIELYEPSGEYYGGQIAAPVFANLMAQAFPVVGDAPNSPPVPVHRVPEVKGLTGQAAIAALMGQGLVGRVLGPAGPVVGTLPLAGAQVPRGSEVLVFTGRALGGEVSVPDLVNRSVNEAGRVLAAAGLRLKVIRDGPGPVTGQRPRAGERLAPGAVVEVDLGARSGSGSNGSASSR